MARQYTDEETRRSARRVVDADPDPIVVPEREVVEERSVAADPIPAGREYGYVRETRRHWNAADTAVQVVTLVFGVIEGLLLIRFALKALGANPAAGFASFIYDVTGPLLAPFTGLFGTPSAANGGVFETTTLVAIVVYALIAWALAALVRVAFGAAARPVGGVDPVAPGDVTVDERRAWRR